MEAFESARKDLRRWREQVPNNFYSAESALQHLLRFYLEPRRLRAMEPRLQKFGAVCATVIDRAAMENDRIGNHPRLVRWNDLGQRIEEIEFHPSYHEAGRPAIESGILALQTEPGHAVEQAALFYLLSHCGEMGHACPIACTSGLIRALQKKGSRELQSRYLPGLLSDRYDERLVGAQFVTEIQGGSDVGANACLAVPVADRPGEWRIRGEKWFCSVANADLFLMSARPENAPGGTRGLGAFVVPRRLPDGGLNRFSIRRLKDKFGTRTLATAEIDFEDALAYQLGDADEGFKIIIEMVLNVSRWFNAVGSCGLMQRGLLEAEAFARTRTAFGGKIIDYPLVKEALAQIKTSLYAGLASTFYLSHLIDRIDTEKSDSEERAVHRLLVNINKYRTSIDASLALRRAQEILGGNGAVETFSVIPRLYRDSVVYESWEGSHNVLCLQVLRDCRKYGFHTAYFHTIREKLQKVQRDELRDSVAATQQRTREAERRLVSLLEHDDAFAALHIRRLVDEMAACMQLACMLEFADWQLRNSLATDWPAAIRYFLTVRLSQLDLFDDARYASVLQDLVS